MNTRLSFTVMPHSPFASSRFVATLGDYDLDAPCGYGPDAASAIMDWLEMWGDTLSEGGDA